MYVDDGTGSHRSRVAQDRSGQGRTKKRRRVGGQSSEPTDASGGYSALIPEDEWDYIVTEYAQAFGQDPWRVDRCEPHGRPELIWYWYYHLVEHQRITELRRELDDFDRACLSAYAVNAPKELETRRRELRRRLQHDPSAPIKPQWSDKEMREAAQRMMSSVLKTGKLVS